jgi:sensor c-di-GMP phosphodiesterase-like protein
MRPLRAMGVGLAIDDFGSGHANLSILTRLPFDVFKIDRQFVSALQTDQQAPAIVEMILAMAETLGLKTVAEGVETPLQADFLRRRGCSMAQGFLYSPPLPAEDFLILLRNWSVQGPAATAGATLRLA